MALGDNAAQVDNGVPSPHRNFSLCRRRVYRGMRRGIQAEVAIFKIVCETICFELEASKEQPHSSKISLLRAEFAIGESCLTATIPHVKRKDLIGELRQIPQKNTLSPPHAAEIRGRLGFPQPLLFGRIDRALLYEPTARQ